VWQARQPAPITAMAPFKYQPKLINGILLGLSNGEVRLYNDQHLLNTLTLPNGRPRRGWGKHGSPMPSSSENGDPASLKSLPFFVF